MKVLLDENLPHKLRLALDAHEVATATYLGWAGIKNGELLRLAEANGFEVMITADHGILYQQNLTDRRIAIIYLTAQTWELLFPCLPAIMVALASAVPCSFQAVDCGEFQR